MLSLLMHYIHIYRKFTKILQDFTSAHIFHLISISYYYSTLLQKNKYCTIVLYSLACHHLLISIDCLYWWFWNTISSLFSAELRRTLPGLRIKRSVTLVTRLSLLFAPRWTEVVENWNSRHSYSRIESQECDTMYKHLAQIWISICVAQLIILSASVRPRIFCT